MSENGLPPDRPSGPIRIPEGLWVKCKACKEIIYSKEVQRLGKICPKCGYHFALSARERLESLCDEGKYETFDDGIGASDPLKFKDKKKYKDRVKELQETLGAVEAVVCAEGQV